LVLAVLGALAGLTYGIYALIARRGIYSDIADDPSSVLADDAESSDTLNAVLLWVAVALIVLALLLWLAAIVSARRGRGGLGWTGLVLVLAGGAAAIVGAVLVGGVGSASEAGDGATGYVVVGVGFLLMSLGLLLGAAALRREASPAGTGSQPGPYGGGAYPDPYAGASPYGGPPPYAGPPPPGQQGGQGGPGPYAPPPPSARP